MYQQEKKGDSPEKRQLTPTPVYPQKKSKLWLLLLLIPLFFLLIGGGALYYFYQQNSEAEAYSILASNEEIGDYEAFLEKYPNSKYAQEVRMGLKYLKEMYVEWARIEHSNYTSDFKQFKEKFPQSTLIKQCDLKIDSLDWSEAVKLNTIEAFETYMSNHPDGRYLSEAAVALNITQGTKVDEAVQELINLTIEAFFNAYANNDEAMVCANITPVMKKFITRSDVTKAQVVDIINRTYNEHIQSCTFVINNDYEYKKVTNNEGKTTYSVSFSVDQHIKRDNEGKTFGSYTAQAELNEQFQISSLSLNEVSRRVSTVPSSLEEE